MVSIYFLLRHDHSQMVSNRKSCFHKCLGSLTPLGYHIDKRCVHSVIRFSLITISLCQNIFVRSWQQWQHRANVWDVVSKSRILRRWSHFSLLFSCSFLEINFSHTMKLIWTNTKSKVSAEWGHVPLSKQCKIL